MKKVYIIAGEASGDLHGSNLIKALLKKQPDWQIRGMGGDKMRSAGVTLKQHYKDYDFMGFVEVVAHLPKILKNISNIKKDIDAFQPDAIILIDYPSFNLRMAKHCHERGIKVIYYISPQVWAWKQSRIKKIRKYVDQLLCILPFEETFFADKNVPALYVGHPLLDAVSEFKKTHSGNQIQTTKPLITLLPGSRRMEIENMLPIMLEVSQKYAAQFDFIIGAAPSIDDSLYEKYLAHAKHVKILRNQTYELLQSSFAAIVTSGTATLETGLFAIPQVVCYKGNEISYQIAKRLVDIKYISLVNLILDKPCVTELIQHDLTVEKLTIELEKIIGPEREKMMENYKNLHQILGNSGASEKAAETISQLLN